MYERTRRKIGNVSINARKIQHQMCCGKETSVRGYRGPIENIGCLRCLLVIFLPPLAVINKGIIPVIVVTLCTLFGFWVLGSVAAAMYLGD